MKWLSRLSFVLLSLLALSIARAATTVVYPTGDYPADVQNVQAAVDLGGTVLLKARDAWDAPRAFNFGPAVPGSGLVRLHRDVDLIGEQFGSVITTVQGGSIPIRSVDPIEVTVRGIAFDGPLYGAVFFGNQVTGVSFIANRISRVVGFFDGFVTVAEAVHVVSDRAVIDNNSIDDVDAEIAFGISQYRATGPVAIAGNRVTRVNTVAIESSINAGTVSITDNVLLPGPERYARGFGGIGIEVNGGGSYYVARNSVVYEQWCCGAIVAYGSEVLGFGAVRNAVIEKNQIAVTAWGDGIALSGRVSGAYVGQNNIEGDVFAAIGLYDGNLEPSDLGHCTVVGNNVSRVRSLLADIALDDATHDTVVRGNGGSILDLGTNNRVSGFTVGAGGPGIGEQVSDAIHVRNAAARLAARQTLIGP